jgi:hypothetical protein
MRLTLSGEKHRGISGYEQRLASGSATRPCKKWARVYCQSTATLLYQGWCAQSQLCGWQGGVGMVRGWGVW